MNQNLCDKLRKITKRKIYILNWNEWKFIQQTRPDSVFHNKFFKFPEGFPQSAIYSELDPDSGEIFLIENFFHILFLCLHPIKQISSEAQTQIFAFNF